MPSSRPCAQLCLPEECEEGFGVKDPGAAKPRTCCDCGNTTSMDTFTCEVSKAIRVRSCSLPFAEINRKDECNARRREVSGNPHAVGALARGGCHELTPITRGLLPLHPGCTTASKWRDIW
jgi:hypothetical protein